jgi:hypothetical protein
VIFFPSPILSRAPGSACLLSPPHSHHVTLQASVPACSVPIAAPLTVPAVRLSARPPLSAQYYRRLLDHDNTLAVHNTAAGTTYITWCIEPTEKWRSVLRAQVETCTCFRSGETSAMLLNTQMWRKWVLQKNSAILTAWKSKRPVSTVLFLQIKLNLLSVFTQ